MKLIVCIVSSLLAVVSPVGAQPDGYELVWSDEFSTEGRLVYFRRRGSGAYPAQVYLVDLERIGGTECGTDVVCTAYVVKNDDDAGFGGFPVLFGSHPSEFDIEKFSVACFHLCAISEKVINTKLRKNKKLTTFAVCVVLDLDLRNLINIYETRSSDFQSYQKRGRKAD